MTESKKADIARKREILRDVLDTILSGKENSLARHFAPAAVFTSRSNAGLLDAPWFDRLEGDFRFSSHEDIHNYFDELLRRANYISYDLRGIVIEDDHAASLCDWTKRDKRDGSLVTGTTMWWFTFTSDERIRSVECIGSIHSVVPASPRMP